MSVTKHTPGPWWVDETSYEHLEVLTDDHRQYVIATAADLRDYATGNDAIDAITVAALDGESRANARLIAAAPDLLEACEALRREIPAAAVARAEKFSLITIEIDVIRRLFAAIAKARGGA